MKSRVASPLIPPPGVTVHLPSNAPPARQCQNLRQSPSLHNPPQQLLHAIRHQPWRRRYKSWPFAAVFRRCRFRGPIYDELCASWPHADRVDRKTIQPRSRTLKRRGIAAYGVSLVRHEPASLISALEAAMKYIVQWKGLPTTQRPAIERFLKTGGRPPENVQLLGRWHAIGELSGFAIVEATDASGLARWVLQWGDLFAFTCAPAMSDEELGATLAAHQAASA